MRSMITFVWASSALILCVRTQTIIPIASQQTVTCDTGGDCVVQCEDSNLCQSLLIDASNANTFSLTCRGIQSCADARIESPSAGTIAILCDKSTTDSAADSGACAGLQLNGASANNITVECMQARDCVALHINITSLEASNLHFNGEESAVDAYINGGDSFDSFRVFCNAYHACSHAHILCPRREHNIDCHVECDADGACEDMSYVRDVSPSFKSVICPDLSVCSLACHGAHECSASQLFGRYANVMTVSCVGDAACAGTTVYAPNHALHIDCTGDDADSADAGACHWLSIDGTHTTTNEVRVSCRHSFDCLGLSFHSVGTRFLQFAFSGRRSGDAAIINAENVSDNVSIACNSSEACFDTDVYCPSYAAGGACLIDCVGESSCAKMRFFIADAAYSALALQCSEFDRTHCFMLNDSSVPLTYDADVYCLDTFARSPLIYNRWNGQLYCREECCPFVVEEIECTSDECVVDCAYTYCDGRTINGANKQLLHVLCDANEVSMCNELTVICPSNGECNIACATPNGCQSLTVQHLSDGVENQAQITLTCAAQSQCDGVTMQVANASVVQIEALNLHSLSNAQIHAEHVGVLQLLCDSTPYHAVAVDPNIADVAACLDNQLYVGDASHGHSIHVYCTGHSCAVNAIYVEQGWTTLADNLDFVVDSNCGQCGDAGWQSCLGGVQLFCGAALELMQSLVAGECSPSEADVCGCSLLRDDIEANYVSELEACVSQVASTTTTTTTTTPSSGIGSGAEDGVGGGAVAGIVLAMLIAICGGLALWYWCWYKKQQKELHELQFEDESGDEAMTGDVGHNYGGGGGGGTKKRKQSHHKQQSTLDISITDAVCADVLPENLLGAIEENDNDEQDEDALQEPAIDN